MLGAIDAIRVAAASRQNRSRQAALGQYFTPVGVATLMTSMSSLGGGHIRLLDPGAGVGVLAASWVVNACSRADPPSLIELTAYEMDAELIPYLAQLLELCQQYCERRGVQLTIDVR